jgi:hypothetical protein
MKTIYENDDDIEFIVYPDDASSRKFPKRQPKADENASGTVDGKDFPSEENKEIITLVKYGSKAKRVNYYFCPRLFCVRDRLMVRYKDFKSAVDRKGAAKPVNSCPFCRGILVDPDAFDKDSDRDPNMTVLQRKTRPGSETERQIYIGFLEKKKNPSGMSLPCCFADPNERFTSDNNDEFIRLGLRPISKAEGKRAAAPAPTAAPLLLLLLNTLLKSLLLRILLLNALIQSFLLSLNGLGEFHTLLKQAINSILAALLIRLRNILRISVAGKERASIRAHTISIITRRLRILRNFKGAYWTRINHVVADN